MLDCIIVGSGVAGISVALTLKANGKSFMMIGSKTLSDKITKAEEIRNYPAFVGVTGKQFANILLEQLQTEEIEITEGRVNGVYSMKDKFVVTTQDGGMYESKTVALACGVESGKRMIGENDFLGRGVSYCATCDGMLYKDKTVAVVGGGNSAVQDALLLSRICKKVYLIHRRDTLRATKIYHEPLMKTENVEFLWNSAVDEFLFEKKLHAINVKNLKDGSTKTVELDGIFISIGRAPVSELFKNEITLDEQGYIVADESTKTNIPGVFAAGDIRTKSLRQVVTAAADGAVAAHFAEEYISQL
jgi:thioredoxin reductase (NADPH)